MSDLVSESSSGLGGWDKIKGDERGLREVRLRKIARPWLSVKDTQSH